MVVLYWMEKYREEAFEAGAFNKHTDQVLNKTGNPKVARSS